MNRNSAWRRKMVYLGIIVIMLLPLYLLGQPATSSSEGGGSLARMRSDLNLSLSNLGEIDPASESMKLATLGMRGPAATILWNKAEDFRRHQEWDRLSATLNQIVLLQPHFEKVWEYQAHNLSYNISTEFDDYRQRYKWVKQGTRFLTRGVKLNRREPRLIWYTGWFYGQKLGISDEKTQFRELFRNDEAFHEQIANDGLNIDDALGPSVTGKKPDNWLVGRLWLYYGYDLVDSGVPLINKSPMTFYDSGPKWSIRHADAIAEEGNLELGTAQSTWRNAEIDWEGFGRRDIMSTEGFTIQLGGVEDSRNKVARIEEEFDKLTGDRRKKFREEQLAKMSDEVREAFETDRSELTRKQSDLIIQNRHNLVTSMKEIALGLPKEKQLTALRLAKEYEQADRYAKRVKAYRQQSNYGYWLERTRAEQDETTVAARRKVFQADELWDQADLDAAKEKYDEAWVLWAKVYDDHALLIDDDSADDLIISVKRYKRMLDLEELPEDFPLKVFVQMDAENEKSPEEYLRRVAEWRETIAAKKSKDEESEASPEESKSEKLDDGEGDNERSDAESSPKEMKPEEEEPDEEKADEEKPAEEKADEEKADEEKADEEKADEEKADEEKADEEKADEEKADEEKADEEKADEEKADEEKADEEKADEEKADEEKADEEQPDEEKADEEKADEEQADEEKNSD